MKNISAFLLLVKLAHSKVRLKCGSPPETLSQSSEWSCDKEDSDGSFKSGSICTIQGGDCSGQVKCKNGRWIGKTHKFCPKNCPTPPEEPSFGAKWNCLNEHHSSCDLEIFQDYKCSNSVSCNTKNGEWKGKVSCKFTGERNHEEDLPARPHGTVRSKKSDGTL